MHHGRTAVCARICFGVAVLIIAAPVKVHAYIDPGTTGMVSQMLYVLFYGALGVFLYFLRYIKQYLAGAKQFFAKLFGLES